MEPEGVEPSTSRAFRAGFTGSHPTTRNPPAGALSLFVLRPQSGDGGSRTRSILVASEAPCPQSIVPIAEGKGGGEPPPRSLE